MLGAPLIAVPAIGVGVLGILAAAGRRSRARSGVSTSITLTPTWQAHVDNAIASHQRYVEVAATINDPTLRSEIDAIGHRLRHGIDTMREVALQGQHLDGAIDALPNPSNLRHKLRGLKHNGVDHDDPRWTSVAYQLDTVETTKKQRKDVIARLDVLEAQLDAAVVQAIQTGLTADRSSIRAVGDAVEVALSDLDALNQALHEIGEIG